jgi:hypothetical protein
MSLPPFSCSCVTSAATWQAMLHCLNNSDFNIRKSALEDINTILHDKCVLSVVVLAVLLRIACRVSVA